jgi:hypothetical protein
MCCGGIYLDVTTGKLIKVYFPIPNVLFPVIDERGSFALCRWGQREKDEKLVQELPITGWARMESLEKPFWTKHKPEKVRIPLKIFMEKDRTDPLYPKNKATEFKLCDNEMLLGLLIKHKNEKIVYVITEHKKNWIHDRCPIIITS